MKTDKHGLDYEATLAIQFNHLAQWRKRLDPGFFAEIHIYVLSVNQEANDATSKHRVYRGTELANIVFDWPELKPCYAPRPAKGDEFV